MAKTKSAMQECIERSPSIDFMLWFHTNKERLYELEKEQIQNAHLAG